VRSSRVVLAIAMLIATVVLGFPCFALLLEQFPTSQATLGISDMSIITRTLAWSFTIGVVATAIGWPLGLRIPTFSRGMRRLVYTTLVLTLALPAYAVYYAWWQAWPAGTAIHGFIVQYELLGLATRATLALSLIGWSWPIAALIAAMCGSHRNALQLLHRIDGVSCTVRTLHHVRAHLPILIASCVLIASITAANTTCFDLAQVPTIANELRAVVAAGGSMSDVPMLVVSSIFLAAVASCLVVRLTPPSRQVAVAPLRKSAVPIMLLWGLLSGGPIVLGSMHASGVDSALLFSQYGGDLTRSVATAMMTAAGCLIVLVISAMLHSATSLQVRKVANMLDFLWITVALLPATLLAEGEILAWNQPLLAPVYRSPLLVVIAQIAHFGFVASLAGRWAGADRSMRVLLSCDAPKSPVVLFSVMRVRVLASACVVVAVSGAMSMGEVAMTSQLSSPAGDQPIAISLLNAMHYQRPQIVTATMLCIVSFAALAGVVVSLSTRRIAFSLLLCSFAVGCRDATQSSEAKQIVPVSIIGGAGGTDGRFITPRAADYDSGVTVVIDKSGRLQRFNSEGLFLSSWILPQSGNGFPTGVTIGSDGSIWIADTHGHRVWVLDAHGDELLTFGTYGTGDGQFLYPTDIAFGGDGTVYVSEYGGNDRISVFTKEGAFLRSFGHHGKETDAFRRPQSIVLHPVSGELYVADSANHRIVVYSVAGTVLRSFGSVGDQQGELLYPYGIEILQDGTLLVTEFGNNRIQQFSEEGDSLGLWGRAGTSQGAFKTPWGAVVVEQGVFIIDTGNNRLQVLDAFMMPHT